MKGYYTRYCYMGYVPKFHQFLPFATEEEYKAFYKANETN